MPYSDPIVRKQKAQEYRNLHKDEKKAVNKKYRAEHKEEISEYKKEYRKDNLEKIRNQPCRTGTAPNKRRRLNKYGLSISEYEALLLKQDFMCAICGRQFDMRPEAPHQSVPHIDHDHETNAVRGLLCQRCNMGIGLLQDSSSIIDSASTYLKKHKK